MTMSATKTVREYAVEQPGAVTVFERLGIDFCCGGARPLDEACSVAGIDLESVLAQLKEAAASQSESENFRDWNKADATEIIAFLLDTHHVYTKNALARLPQLVAKVRDAHRANHPELEQLAVSFEHLCNDLGPHLFKEENVLFPYLLNLDRAMKGTGSVGPSCFGTVRNPVRAMMFEHDAAGDILQRIRETTGNYTVPEDACTSFQILYRDLHAFEQDLHRHIHLENNVLFPLAIKLEDAYFTNRATAAQSCI